MIIETNKSRIIAMRDMQPGEVFEYHDKYYMKTDAEFNAVNLATGSLEYLREIDSVKRVEAKVVID